MLAERFQLAVKEFVKKATAFQAAHLWGHEHAPAPSPIDRVVAYALSSGRALLRSEGALSVSIKTGGLDVQITRRLGNASLTNDFTLRLKNAHYQRVRAPRSSRQSVWFDKRNVIAAYSMPQQDDQGYLVFFNIQKRLRKTQVITALSSFTQIFEAVLASTMTIDFLEDQKRLLSRRTIVAQLRPNDLFYQALRRLHKYVGWERSAVILHSRSNIGDPGSKKARSAPPKRPSVEWYIAAERVRGVSEVSQRVGMRFGVNVGLIESPEIKPRVIHHLQELHTKEAPAWDRLVYEVLTKSEGLPQHLNEAKSALIVPIGATPITEGENGDALSTEPPFVVILSDSRPERFTEEHGQLVKEFFSDIPPLLKNSESFSERLIKLWTPLRTASAEDAPASKHPESPGTMDHPDIIESLRGEDALPNEALEVLGVDALQVLQLRRGSIRKVTTGKIDLLTSTSVEKGKEQGPIEFLRSTGLATIITSQSNILWRVFAERAEFSHKDFSGLDTKRFANLIPCVNPEKVYRTVLIEPILSEGEFAGALLAYRKKQSEFVDVDRLLLRSLAARLGERIELHRKLADHVRLVICLFRVATASDANAARRALVEGANEMLNSDHVFMMEVKDPLAITDRAYSPEIDEVAHTWEDGRMSVRRIKADVEGITGEVFTLGKPLAVTDVSKFKKYVPILTPSRKTVKVASELAVPIKASFSATDYEQTRVLGVLDALWRQPHRITLREVNTLRALAGPAAALLQLTTGLQVALQMRQSLQKLLNDAIPLQEAKTREQVIAWLASTVLGTPTSSALIDCDMLVVWEHVRGSRYMSLLSVHGERANELEGVRQLRCEGSWTAGVIQRFREGELKSAYDYYDNPAPERKHIRGTRRDRYQSIVVRCINPSSSATEGTPGELETVWAVSLFRFRRSNFNAHDEVLLQFAAEYCEAALQKLDSIQEQARSLQLAKASQDVALKMISSLRSDQREVVDYICERICEEIRASSVVILYYETGSSTAPTYFAYPKTSKQSDPPRKDGLSEAVRAAGEMVTVNDTHNPPSAFRKAIKSSPFLNTHPRIRAFIAVPLFEAPAGSSKGGFFGVMYVNFAEKCKSTQTELEFLNIMQRFLAECGGIEGKLLQMRAQAIRNVQKIADPGQVFKQILTVALDTLRSEFPPSVRTDPRFELGGNLYMVTEGQPRAKLRVRDNVGELTGKQAGVQEIGEGVIGWVAKNGQPMLVDDTKSRSSRELGYLPYLKNMRSELAVPISLPNAPDIDASVANGVIGVINVECSIPGVFTARLQNLLMRFSASPVALILYLAERHGQRLWQVRKDEEDFLGEVAYHVMHDLTSPMITLGFQVDAIRKDLPRDELRKIERTLKQMEQESRAWVEIRKTGLHFLSRKTLSQRKSLDVVEQIRAWAARRKVRMYKSRVHDFFSPKGHPELIASVLENLYSNSMKAQKKAGQRNGKVWITFDRTQDFSGVGPHLDVFFHDNGPGIDTYQPERWDELLRPFEPQRRKSQGKWVSKDGGWGLGLPLTRRMMHLMGGTINIVDSRPYQRTTFRLRFMALPIRETR
jgi:GAF domain-containing protein